jgi:hypothetical protein
VSAEEDLCFFYHNIINLVLNEHMLNGLLNGLLVWPLLLLPGYFQFIYLFPLKMLLYYVELMFIITKGFAPVVD